MRKSFRFWLVYSVAWLPYAASYMTLFITHLGRTFSEAIKGSIINVLPAALLGIGVVAVSQRLRWSTKNRYKFLTAHLVLASVYVFLWMNAVPFLNAVGQLVQSGTWSFRREGSFQGGFFTGLLIYVTIAGIVYAVQTTERLRAEEARATRAENLRTRAELEALRAQLIHISIQYVAFTDGPGEARSSPGRRCIGEISCIVTPHADDYEGRGRR